MLTRKLIPILLIIGLNNDVCLASFTQPSAIAFEENMGQIAHTDGTLADEVLFRAGTKGFSIYVTNKGLSYVFTKRLKKEYTDKNEHVPFDEVLHKKVSNTIYSMVNVHVKGASILPENIIKEESLAGQLGYRNYYLPHCPKGATSIAAYGKLIIKNVYPNIDWVLYTNPADNHSIKYDFVVNPGGDPNLITLQYEGDANVKLLENGAISIVTSLGKVIENAPVTYTSQSKEPIASNYVVSEKETEHKRWKTPHFSSEIKFDIAHYDNSQTLVIDPELVWGTYFHSPDSGSLDGFTANCVDADGNLYITGYHSGGGYPAVDIGGYYDTTTTSIDVIITRFDSTQNLIWSTLIGGSNIDIAESITTDVTSGRVYLVGVGYSGDYPTVDNGGYFEGIGGNWQVNSFISGFDNGGNLFWSTYMGNPGTCHGMDIEVDCYSNLYVVGQAENSFIDTMDSGGFFDDDLGGNFDGFITKYNGNTDLVWGTYFGGSGVDRITSIHLNNGKAVVLGFTTSSDLPILDIGGYYDDVAVGFEVFVAEFNFSDNLLWSTFIGGSGEDRPGTVKYNNADEVVLMVRTSSFDYPMMNSGEYFDNTLAGMDYGISKFDQSRNMVWSTYFGGSGNELLPEGGREQLVIDDCRNIYIVGETGSLDFPLFNSGNFYSDTPKESVLASFNANDQLAWSTYFGSSYHAGERRNNIALGLDKLYVSGEVHGNDFNAIKNPQNGGFFDDSNIGGDDGYIIAFDIQPFCQNSLGNCNASIDLDESCGCQNEAMVNLSWGQAPYDYNWSSGGTTDIEQGLCPGTYTVTITDVNSQTITLTVDVIGQGLPIVNASSDTVICPGNGVMLSATGAQSYSWFPPTGLSTDSGDVVLAQPIEQTTYYVTGIDSAGCENVDSVTISFFNEPIPNLGPDMVLCKGDIYELTPGEYEAYSWQDNSNSSAFIVEKSGNYHVEVTDENGCKGSDTTIVTFSAIPEVMIQEEKGDCFEVLLTAISSEGEEYLWSTGERSQKIVISSSDEYTVTVNNGQCENNDAINISIEHNQSEVIIPNVFTPNGDKVNDELIFQLPETNSFYLKVFNRWGTQVFESSDFNNYWKGEGMPEGVYNYELMYTTLCGSGELIQHTGYITLLR